jgi:hypothetical protein
VVLSVKAGTELAVKMLKKSNSEFDRPYLCEVFTEVSILNRCGRDRRVTQQHDYDCRPGTYYIAMEYYPATLKQWRRQQESTDLETLLGLYREFLQAATVLGD